MLPVLLVGVRLHGRGKVYHFSPGDLTIRRGDHVIVEFDGAVKYEGAQGRSALVAEKRREDALRALGYVVVRVTWSDLASPTRVISQIRRALAGLSTRDGHVFTP